MLNIFLTFSCGGGKEKRTGKEEEIEEEKKNG